MTTLDASTARHWFTPSDRQPTPAGIARTLLPSLVYLAAHAVVGPGSAMVAASVAAAGVLLAGRWRGRSVGVLLPATLAYLSLRTVLGLATGSDLLYFGGGLILSAVAAVAVGTTAFTRTPVAVHLIPLVSTYGHLTPAHPAYRRVAAHVTFVWAVAELTTVGIELQHLLHGGGAAYVQSRTTVALPAMAGLVWLLIFYVRARLDPVEFHLARRATSGVTQRPTRTPRAAGPDPSRSPDRSARPST